jgi:2-oxoglutarate dehydrogenase E1 component
MAHVLNKPYAQILAEFKEPVSSREFADMAWTGDVKYHAGARRAIKGGPEMDVVVSMPPNPSHLEAIDPVVEGMARAAGTVVDSPGAPVFDPSRSVPILLHGDAAFPGQGVVAETLNLGRLPGYSTGRSTSSPTTSSGSRPASASPTARRTRRARARLQDPIVHVNADDPAACVEAARLAMAYCAVPRDFLIDLIGHRRWATTRGTSRRSRSRCPEDRVAPDGPRSGPHAGRARRRAA